MILIDQPPKSQHKELRPLTGIRSFAALWVFLYHTRPEMSEAYPRCIWLIEGLTSRGYLGVDLFFTLSGFILTYNYCDVFQKFDIHKYLKFLCLRLARIYPVHLFVLLLFVVAVAGADIMNISLTIPEFFNFPDFIKNLFLVQAWSIPVRPSWNTLSWSVSCEWMAYLWMPAFLLIFRNKKLPYYLIWYVVLSLCLVFLPEILAFTTTYSYGIVRIAFEFNLGIIIFHLYRSNIGKNLPWNLILPLIILIILVTSFFAIGKALPLFALAPLFGLAILGIVYESSHISRLLSLKPFVYGGYVSYSFYMIHELVLLIARKAYKFIPSTFSYYLQPVWIVALFLTTFVFAVLIYHFIEERSRIFLRQQLIIGKLS